MTLNLDDMSVKHLRKHAIEVAKALVRKEASRANDLRKKVVDYAKQLGSSIGERFSKDDVTLEIEDTTTKSKPAAAIKSEKKPKYVEADGTPRQRLGKWSEKYTKDQLEKLKQK
jgi:predicted Zn-dependent protease